MLAEHVHWAVPAVGTGDSSWWSRPRPLEHERRRAEDVAQRRREVEHGYRNLEPRDSSGRVRSHEPEPGLRSVVLRRRRIQERRSRFDMDAPQARIRHRLCLVHRNRPCESECRLRRHQRRGTLQEYRLRRDLDGPRERGTSPVVQGVTIDPTDNRRVFLAKSNGVYLSENAGATWAQVLTLASWGITIDESDPSIVFITSKTNGVFRSFDAGRTFAPSSVGLGSLTMGRAAKVTIDPTDARVLYVGSEAHGGGAVYKSSDRGDQWSAANEGIESIAVFALAMDPNEPSVLYATGPEGTYKTRSGGESRRESPPYGWTRSASRFVATHPMMISAR